MSSMPENQTPEERRAERAKWPVRKGRLTEIENGDETDVSPYTTIEQRFSMMWQIAQTVWAMGGEKVDESSFPRNTGRLIRREG